eukprot:TRINITY_DN27564_c0_g1_i1.p1 TRINITY_DN27564_c0_g1~~TRINITY_DN27564_c0_g1_i1.p1  ORF type:complete len:295 (-),score=32.18 TRINITY_DN27564_c0_g1_i1:391-1218(-)
MQTSPLHSRHVPSFPYVHGPEQMMYKTVMPFADCILLALLLIMLVVVGPDVLLVYIFIPVLVLSKLILAGVACYLSAKVKQPLRDLQRACENSMLSLNWEYEQQVWTSEVERALGDDTEDFKGIKRAMWINFLASPVWGLGATYLLVVKAGKGKDPDASNMIRDWGYFGSYLFLTVCAGIAWASAWLFLVWDRRQRRRCLLRSPEGRRVVALADVGLIALGQYYVGASDLTWSREGDRVSLRFRDDGLLTELSLPMPQVGYQESDSRALPAEVRG